MKEKVEYKNAIRSKKLIRQAFAELMEEKSINKITVTDIVKRADINRGTFYAHYENAYAVIEQIENEIIDNMLELLSEFKYRSFLHNPLPILKKIEYLIESDVDLFRKLVNVHGSEQFIEKLKRMAFEILLKNSDIPEDIINSKDFKMRSNFFVGGMIHLYQAWFKNEIKCKLSDITNEIATQVKLMVLLLEGKDN